MMTSEPPQPPQKHSSRVGQVRQHRRWAGRSRCRSAAGCPAPGRCRSHCSSKMRSIVSGDSSRTPSTSPPFGDDRLDVRHRAGVAVAVGRADARPGATRSSTTTERVGRGAGERLDASRCRGRASPRRAAAAAAGSTLDDPVVELRGSRPMWKSAPSGPAISSAKNVAERQRR